MAKTENIFGELGGGSIPSFGGKPDQVLNKVDAPNSGSEAITVTQKPRYIVYGMVRKATTYIYMTGIIDVENERAWRVGYTAGGAANGVWNDWASEFTTISDSQVVINYAHRNYEKRINVQIFY